MPADIWVNIDGVNRQYDKGYVNIDGTWREIDKVWVNIGGTWREVNFEFLLNYIGQAPNLTSVAYHCAVAKVGNYALFAGGASSYLSGSDLDNVDAYTVSLVKTTPAKLSVARGQAWGAYTSSHALIGGYRTSVDTYNASLVRGSAPEMARGLIGMSSGQVGDYAFFAGGFYNDDITYYSSDVYAYSSSLVKSILSLSSSRSAMTVASVANYILFIGGVGPRLSTAVDCYNTSLVKVNVDRLPSSDQSPENVAGASNQNYALCIGGGFETKTAVAHAWNSSLVRTTPPNLTNQNRSRSNAGASHSAYAVFSGGEAFESETYVQAQDVNYYDVNLVRRSATNLPIGLRDHKMITLDNVMFIGSGVANNDYTSAIYAYKIE
ncbi:hypothetical protein [Clostridium thermosuccinogenes]|uniref:hypothetical protein n=1 Tax=Clostridium thermosuccinogenes TaxID=84032 RepID=UPI000CCC7DF8|nr:hypothetical protein [Pseudoclostridium thermosuccinogenes]PNT91298.1 hypothetical protein CDQ83_15980 [Pseudoclostridium thermosuccinogenes]